VVVFSPANNSRELGAWFVNRILEEFKSAYSQYILPHKIKCKTQNLKSFQKVLPNLYREFAQCVIDKIGMSLARESDNLGIVPNRTSWLCVWYSPRFCQDLDIASGSDSDQSGSPSFTSQDTKFWQSGDALTGLFALLGNVRKQYSLALPLTNANNEEKQHTQEAQIQAQLQLQLQTQAAQSQAQTHKHAFLDDNTVNALIVLIHKAAKLLSIPTETQIESDAFSSIELELSTQTDSSIRFWVFRYGSLVLALPTVDASSSASSAATTSATSCTSLPNLLAHIVNDISTLEMIFQHTKHL
jgi:hypothetical protein